MLGHFGLVNAAGALHSAERDFSSNQDYPDEKSILRWLQIDGITLLEGSCP